ncbi:MAG: hypothetical protein WBG69_04390 [Arcobacteraceae bacterium]
MNTNNKLLILLTLFIVTIVSLFYVDSSNKDVKEQFYLYEKTANEIAIIKNLKEYYGDKKSNKRKINNTISKYSSKIANKKEDKNSLEFTVNKLSHKELDSLNKEILNSGVKVIKLNIRKIDANSGELFCKVMF